MPERRSLYRHSGAGLLRAAVLPVGAGLTRWPDLTDAGACHAWLVEAWALPGFADAVRQASVALAERAGHIVTGGRCDAKQQRRAAASVVRYLLRAIGRPTPFGLFAGVAATSVGRTVEVRWGHEHRAVTRADTQWLSEIVDRLENDAELLDHLDVVAEQPRRPPRQALGGVPRTGPGIGALDSRRGVGARHGSGTDPVRHVGREAGRRSTGPRIGHRSARW